MLEKAKQQALKYLLIRPRSEREMRQYLQKKQYERDIIDKVIAYLQQYHYLDELKFCEAWINSRINLKPTGRYKIKNELKEKGIDGTIIDEALMQFYPYETELALAQQLANKKASQNLPYEKIKRHLAYKGFDYDLIEAVVDKTNQ